MKVWIVGVSDCEGNSIVAICSTKEIAERELFRARDNLIEEYRRMNEYVTTGRYPSQMYKDMISNLSENNYEKWDNYPHERPYLYETEIIET